MTARKHIFKLILLLTILNTYTKTQAQTIDLPYHSTKLDEKPTFPGGFDEFYKFVGTNYKMPEIKDLQGKVYVTFVIDIDGSVVDIKILRDIGYGTGEEAIRVLQNSPKWNPGKQNGQTVRVLYSLPITIQTSNKTSGKVYLTKDVFEKPTYPGGMQNFYTDLSKLYKTLEIEGLKGKMYVTFIVETDGRLTNTKIIKDIGYGTGEEALRSIALLKKWIPAKLENGTIVRTVYSLPITIQSEE
ncbi:MAG: hypothetical protein RLZZ540_1759 [Bacteroidota bacterium]|jgi:hypothetical protein